MKKWKQALALVLALVMALSLVALPSFAEGEETGGGTETTQPVWPAEGSIKLDKDAKAVEGHENLWEVTLGIQSKNYKTTSDVHRLLRQYEGGQQAHQHPQGRQGLR